MFETPLLPGGVKRYCVYLVFYPEDAGRLLSPSPFVQPGEVCFVGVSSRKSFHPDLTRNSNEKLAHLAQFSSYKLRIQVNETGLPPDEARDIVKKWVRSKGLLSNNTGPLLNENNWDL